jgi:hypothetical protein
MDSMSLVFKKFNGFLALEAPKPTFCPIGLTSSLVKGTPSTTNSGVLPLRIEPIPLMVTSTPPPGSPLDATTLTPATLP